MVITTTNGDSEDSIPIPKKLVKGAKKCILHSDSEEEPPKKKSAAKEKKKSTKKNKVFLTVNYCKTR